MKFFKPILPSPRFLSTDEIQADKNGNPLLERRVFLLDCRLPEGVVQRDYPRLWKYTRTGEERTMLRRAIYAAQELLGDSAREPPRTIVPMHIHGQKQSKEKRGSITLYSKPLNGHSSKCLFALAYPKTELGQALLAKPQLKKEIWTWLNSIAPDVVLGEGRLYGGGLHKIEPRELGNVPADGIEKLLKTSLSRKNLSNLISLLQTKTP